MARYARGGMGEAGSKPEWSLAGAVTLEDVRAAAGRLLGVARRTPVVTAVSAVVACISNTGPGLNEVGPATTYAVLTDFQTWICALAMLIGRLELFSVLLIFARGYWRR